jgi:hypothetical protein
MKNSCGMNETTSLWTLLRDETILSTLCLFLPSICIRLRRVAMKFLNFFHDERLAELLPSTFEKLGLFYTNPFEHCHNSHTESVWLMLVHGVDPCITDQVCPYVSQFTSVLEW